MKIFHTLCLCAFAALPALAAESELSGEALGQMEGIVAVCSQVNPKDAAKYQELVESMIEGESEKTLAAVRKTPQYKQVHQSLLSELGKGNDEQAVQACAKFLEMGHPS